ncbi:hypothetical protein ACJRO7_005374 [Eucalyptus globulus]|uniref:Uncharacterized protein n=1 Tax=Eucalyptus globulus TaxID=34317 RepID=A0ABD3J2M2_EUCGL
MAEGSVSSNEPPPQEEVHRFRWLRGPCGSLEIKRIQDVPISSPIKNITIRDVPTLYPIKKTTIRDELKSLNFVLRSLEIQGVTIFSSWLSSLSSSLSSLKFLQINEFVWTPELGDLRSLPTLYEDWDKKRSNDSVSPDRGQHNMAEGSVSSNEPPLKKLRPQEEVHRFRWLQGPGGSLKIEKIQDVPISSPIKNISPIKKSTIRDELKSLNFVLRSLEIHGVTISLSWLSSLLSSLSSSLSSLKFLQINEFVWTPELGDLRSLPTLYEDWVNKKRSNDSVSPDREEDNHVSSGNNVK